MKGVKQGLAHCPVTTSSLPLPHLLVLPVDANVERISDDGYGP